MYNKTEVYSYIWQYSRYYGNLIGQCDTIQQKCNSHAALIYLFNLLEIILKSKVENNEVELWILINKLKEEKLISTIEHNYLNNSKNGIRKIRNIFSHNNLSKYNFIFCNKDNELMYPLTEESSCEKFYDIHSNIIQNIIQNIILKIISEDFTIDLNINCDNYIKENPFKIKEITAEKLLEYKGIDFSIIPGWENMAENEKYRMAENAQDVTLLTILFEKLKSTGEK